jgi:hypothetical protein
VSDDPKHWTEDVQQLDRHVEGVMHASRDRLAVDRSMLKLDVRHPTGLQENGSIISPTGSAVMDSIKAKGENLVREVVDAGSSMLTRDLQTMVTPVDTDHETRQACKHLQTWSDAVKEANGITLLRQRFFRDGANCTAGFILVYADPATEEVKLRRLLPTQCFWDDDECESGEEPLDFFYVDSVPTRRLKAEFPDHAKAIQDAGRYSTPRIAGVDPGRTGTSDNRMVVMAWSRKVGNTPGKYVMKVAKGGPVLDAAETDYEHHPLAHFVWALGYRGWGGISLAQLVAQADLENQDINGMLIRAYRAMVPIIWKKVGTVWESSLTQEEFQVQEYDGAEPPKVEVPKLDMSVLENRHERNRARGFGRAGINPELAQGKRPGPGLNSEPSIDAAVETSTIRLSDHQARWGEAERELTRAIIMVGMATYKGKPEVMVKAPGTGTLKKIDWKAISNLTEKKYEIQTKLASGLSLTWAGRLRDIENVKKVAPSTITEAIALKTLKLNDLETETSRLNAYANEAENLVSRCLEQDGPIPTPFAYGELLRESVSIGKQELMRAVNGDTVYPPARVEALRKFIDKAGKMLADLEPPMPSGQPLPAAPAPGPAGAPPGQAAPPPVVPPQAPPVAA